MGLLDRDFGLTSGERVSTIRIDDIPPDHIARYEFAADALADLPGPLVGADIFCGSGYGTHLLAQRLPCFITGIDGSPDAIARAAEHYIDFNVLFSYKLFPFSLPANHFDFIVSMESIEHVEQGESFFRLLVHALKPGGRLVISAPNADVVNLDKNPYAWHYRHYTVDEIKQLAADCQLKLLQWMGADCTLIDSQGKVVSGNYYSPVSGALKPGHLGDTQTYLFEKPRA